MDMSEQEYGLLVFESAYEYLDKTCGSDELAKSVLPQKQLFWSWWTNQWQRRNRVLVHDLELEKYAGQIISPSASRYVREQFLITHSVERIEEYPNRLVMDDAYAEMIGLLIDAETRKGAAR